MKIKSKVKVHPLYYLVFFICFITGHIKMFITYTIIILVHELGHIFAGLILKWPIDKVTIYPFGCMTKFDNKLNSSVYEEFLILIYGPLFQILFNMIYPTDYHLFILFFNLLPIYPLDGSKLFFLLLNKITSYYYSYINVFIISYITLIFLLINNIDFISVCIISYLMYDVFRYIKMLNNVMLKFYFERYKHPIKYKYNNIVNSSNKHKMFKEKNNFFVINKKCYSEGEILAKMFDK